MRTIKSPKLAGKVSKALIRKAVRKHPPKRKGKDSE